VPVIGRSADDLIIDRMVTALQAFSAEQAAIDPTVAFRVERDRTRMPAMKDMPLVVVWLESLDPQREGSSGRTTSQELARINVDCYAKGLGQDDAEFDDGAAMARLYYLKQQVKYGLFRLVNTDYGFAAGVIGRKRWPAWQVFMNDLKQPETEVVAGRWTLEIEYNWTPEDITGTALDEIAVDAGRWSGIYPYGGD
jgi:hypothetical protein